MRDATQPAALKEKLIAEQERLTRELAELGVSSDSAESGADTPYPRFEEGNAEAVTHSPADEEADEVEEYEATRETVRTLTERFKEVGAALRRIEEGAYGACSVCGKPIDPDRLTANPAAMTDREHAA